MSGTVALVSGGLDSTVLLGWLLSQDRVKLSTAFPVHVLTFKYGSAHQEAESSAAQKVVEFYRTRYYPFIGSYTVLTLPSEFFLGSALTDERASMPTGRTLGEMSKDIAPTYVPARNTVFLALAAGRADAWGANYVAYAAHWEDTPGFLN